MVKKGKKKPFVDKKSSVTFNLVRRSQQDPLIASDAAGEHVLAPLESSKTLDPERKKLEEQKFGIYYDDGYNYLQHLKDANEVHTWEPVENRYRIDISGQVVEAGKDIVIDETVKSSIKLPSSLFETQGTELHVGLLNQAAPRPGPHPEWDPDIVAALDDDFDFEDEDGKLDDDFIIKANAPTTENFQTIREQVEDDSDGYQASDESNFSNDDDDLSEFGQEETRSRFTNYSLTSSVMRRTEGLQRVDAMFEKIYEQYDEEEVGELELEDESSFGGFLEPDSSRIASMLDDFYAKRQAEKDLTKTVMSEKDEKKVVNFEPESDHEQTVVINETERPKERFDCESILSTRSTLYNHPTLIKEPSKKQIRLNKRTGLPDGVMKSSGVSAKYLKQLDGSRLPTDQQMDIDSVDGTIQSRASTCRTKNETKEERRVRKRAIRLERKERRIEKKSNKLAFKEEAVNQQKQRVRGQKHALKLV